MANHTSLFDSSSQIMELDPGDIKVTWRARKDFGDIEALANDIQTNGQIQPITVRQGKKGWVVVGGLRRTRACRHLGIKVRAIAIQPRDAIHSLNIQLSENFKRKNFALLEVGEALLHMKELYEKKDEEGFAKEASSFIDDACEQLDCSKSFINDMIQIAKMDDDAKAKIREAGDTKKQNAAARKELASQRKDRKKQKLQDKAQAKQESRVAEAATKPEPECDHEKPLGVKDDGPSIRLFHEDFREVLAREKKTIGKGFFDLVCADPPYELDWSRISHNNRSDINGEIEWDKLDVNWVLEVEPYLAKDATIVAFCPAEAIGDYRAIFAKAGFEYRGHKAWHKTNPGVVHRDTYLSSMEYFVWATRGHAHFTPWEDQKSARCHNFADGCTAIGDERLDHPTQKPLWLIQQILHRHSAEKHRVLDPFGGVFTTAAACKRMNRVCVSMELDQDYYEQGVARIALIGD